MTLKISQLLKIQEVYEKIKTREMPISVCYKFSKIVNGIEKELEFYKEKQSELVEKYSEKDAEGNPISTPMGDSGVVQIQIKPEYRLQCNAEMNELNNLDVEVPDVEIPLSQLDDLKLTIPEVAAFAPFIKE